MIHFGPNVAERLLEGMLVKQTLVARTSAQRLAERLEPKYSRPDMNSVFSRPGFTIPIRNPIKLSNFVFARTLAVVCLGLFVVLFQQCALAASTEAADRLANDKAVRILEYLRQLPSRPNHRIVSGQLIGSPACCSPLENPAIGARKYVEDLFKATGKMIGMIGVDYNNFNNAFGDKRAPSYGKPVDYTALNTIVKKYSDNGSLVTIGWHANNPWTGRAFNDLSGLGHLGDIIDPNKTVSVAWLKELDTAAAGLLDLQSAGVVVLWRPFLEMNGRWFWWGATQPTPKEFRAVWAHMFHYFSNVKGLHNLLWVYAPNNGAPMYYYPGADLVDIVGVDDYHETTIIDQYGELASLGKPLALTEKGPPLATAGKTSRVFEGLVPVLITKFPLITYFQAWSGPLAIVNNLGRSQLMSDPMIANQSDVLQALNPK